MTLLDDPAFGRITRHLEQLGAGAFALYRDSCLERRLASRIRARGHASLAAYAALLDDEPDERRRLLSALAIGVTSFFRNPSVWTRVAELLRARPPQVTFRAWSAGCATGEEAYSVAMLLAAVGAEPAGPPPGDWQVDASDLDERSLAVGRAGLYPERVVGDIARVVPPVGVSRAGWFEVAPELRTRVRFGRDDLTIAGARGPYDLVVCRNVLIYFGTEGRARALASLSHALAPGGLLVLGRAEMVARDAMPPLALVDGRERIYRRAE